MTTSISFLSIDSLAAKDPIIDDHLYLEKYFVTHVSTQS